MVTPDPNHSLHSARGSVRSPDLHSADAGPARGSCTLAPHGPGDNPQGRIAYRRLRFPHPLMRDQDALQYDYEVCASPSDGLDKSGCDNHDAARPQVGECC